MRNKTTSLGTTTGVFLALLSFVASPAHAEKWALLIGINDYEDRATIASLGAADNDARELKKTLKSQLGFPEANIDLLVSDGDAKPTRSNIIQALVRLSENAKPGDTVFVFYSGHGTEIDGKIYLLPHDFRGRNKFAGTETALEVSKFNEQLKQVKAKALVMAWDMCRNDPFSKGKDGTTKRNPMPSPKAWNLVGSGATARGADGPVQVNLFACSTGETSFEWQDKGRGYFALYLEKGMKGEAADAQGNVTLGSLANYVHQKVPVVTKNNEGHAQTPYPEFGGAGAADFVIATGKPAVVGTPKKPTVTVEPGAETVNLTASMDIKTNVPGAKVTVNKTPLAGTHFETDIDGEQATFEVIVSAEGYKRSVSNVRLVPGKNFVHNVTLAKAPAVVAPVKQPAAKEPATKDPAPSKGVRPTTAMALASQVLSAHRWDEFQKLTSIRLTGAARMTAPENEEMKAFQLTLTPSGDYRGSWLDSSGKNEVGGTAQTSWTKSNGMTVTEIPGAKSLIFPQGVLGTVAVLLQTAPSLWTMSEEGASLVLTAADASGSMKAVIDPETYRIQRIEVSVPTTTGITIRTICTVKRYQVEQGVPLPMTIAVDTYLGTAKMSVTHTYSKAELNVPLRPGFNETN